MLDVSLNNFSQLIYLYSEEVKPNSPSSYPQ